MYGKFLRHHAKLAAHDEKNVAQQGDTVEITTCRPISKTKAYRLLRVIKKGSLTEQAQ
jgi:small subunit ribosomal protein S17